MEYTFKDKTTGESSKIAPERWVWGVVYKPTEAQIEASRIETATRDDILRAERDHRLHVMREKGMAEKELDTIISEYDIRMSLPAGLQGDELHQFGDDGIFHQIGEIDQDRVALVVFYKYDDPARRVDIPFREGMKMIHKYRMIKPAGHTNFIRVYVFGYKYDGHHLFYYVLPDDRVIISPEDDIDLVKFNITPQ